jgi:hypothetical protein
LVCDFSGGPHQGAPIWVADDEYVDIPWKGAGLTSVAGRPGAVDPGFLDTIDVTERVSQTVQDTDGLGEDRAQLGRPGHASVGSHKTGIADPTTRDQTMLFEPGELSADSGLGDTGAVDEFVDRRLVVSSAKQIGE